MVKLNVVDYCTSLFGVSHCQFHVKVKWCRLLRFHIWHKSTRLNGVDYCISLFGVSYYQYHGEVKWHRLLHFHIWCKSLSIK